MTHIPLILLALVWSLPAHAVTCDYKDVPDLLETIEMVPLPMPEFIPGLTKREYEVMGKELKVRHKEFEEILISEI